jgi:hypothetical protein
VRNAGRTPRPRGRAPEVGVRPRVPRGQARRFLCTPAAGPLSPGA